MSIAHMQAIVGVHVTMPIAKGPWLSRLRDRPKGLLCTLRTYDA